MQDNIRSVLDKNINNFMSDDVLCARKVVQKQIEDGYVNITVVNPSGNSFNDYGVDLDGATDLYIPNDNLMYRDSGYSGTAFLQSIQDANLLKIHVGYCYELIVPFANRIIWSLQAFNSGDDLNIARSATDTTTSGYFGPPTGGTFAASCITNPTDNGRFSIVLYSQEIMRMQSDAIQCKLQDNQDPPAC